MALCKEYLEQIQALYLCYLSKTDNFIFGKEIPYLMLINFVALIIVSPVHPSIIPCHCSKSVLKLATKTKQFLAAILVGQVLNSHSCFFPPDSFCDLVIPKCFTSVVAPRQLQSGISFSQSEPHSLT